MNNGQGVENGRLQSQVEAALLSASTRKLKSDEINGALDALRELVRRAGGVDGPWTTDAAIRRRPK
jgi:hypothetical protein